jgi:sugar O-acyltransferase (sialic acid O-acetyltransferase NeuD family)
LEKIILFGTSEGSKLVHLTLSHDTSYEVVAFTVDRAYIKEEKFCGLPVIPFEEVGTIYPPGNYKMLVAIYASEMNKTRAGKYYQAKEKGYTLISYIHPQAIVAPDLVIGDNCFISEGVICRPDLTIGNDVIVMAGAFIGHYTVIKDHCFIGSRAVIMGAVSMEPFCVIGPNATVLEDLTLGRECLIGGGAVIQGNTKEKEVYRANPATLLPLTSDKLEKIIFRKRR